MSRESPYFREIVANLYEHFGHKNNVYSKEYAEYLGRDVELVRRLIRKGELPGKAIGREYIIPITAIALFEIKSSSI